jgi:hypothetical protein
MVTCGITFTFGGLKVDPTANVIDIYGQPIPGLYAAGELIGDLFYFNYPGGTGLTSGAVFGRLAGTGAASSPEPQLPAEGLTRPSPRLSQLPRPGSPGGVRVSPPRRVGGDRRSGSTGRPSSSETDAPASAQMSSPAR